MFRKLFVLIGLSMLLVSCKRGVVAVDVSYDKKTQSDILVMDGEIKFKLPADSLSVSLLIPKGNHTF